MSIRTTLTKAAAATVVPLVLVGAAPVVSADDSVSMPTKDVASGRVPTNGGGLTGNSPGTCNGLEPTIVATTAGANLTFGTDGDDVILGTSEADVIFGNGGNDTICGLDGNDTIYGDYEESIESFGDDVIFGGRGGDTINGGIGSDDIFGGPGGDTIHGDIPGAAAVGHHDLIHGGNDGDHIIAGPGADYVYGDRPDGGYGDDTIDLVTDNVGAGDWAHGGAGVDVMIAVDGNLQYVNGGDQPDVCHTDGADTVVSCP